MWCKAGQPTTKGFVQVWRSGSPSNNKCWNCDVLKSTRKDALPRRWGSPARVLKIAPMLETAPRGRVLQRGIWFPSQTAYSSTGLKALKVIVNIEDIIRNWGMLADGASNVESAKSALEKASHSNRPFNVVLLDMWLNGTDAFELVNFLHMNPGLLANYSTAASSGPCLREKTENHCLGKVPLQNDVRVLLQQTNTPKLETQESTNSAQQIPDAPLAVIMLTSVNLTDANRCKELGTKFYTTKPVKRSLLVRVLQSALGVQDVASDLEGQASSGSENLGRSLHILVAEDNVVNQKVVMKLLQKWGHTFVLACNGAEAVEQSSKEAFDLILMDVQMPICDGFEATSRIREIEKAHDNGKYTPIVAMTAHAMSGDGDRCISAGMDYYISKPLNSKKLQDILQSVATGSLRERSYSTPFLL
ncbi:hypothetical protein L7F22_055852 [Adiantum nelumboides]|nr:hypothetical protein [Adiantum nelumboides]